MMNSILPDVSRKYSLSSDPLMPIIPGPEAASITLAYATIPAINPKPRPPTVIESYKDKNVL